MREAARRIGVSVRTLKRWDRQGRLVPEIRTPTLRRLYSEAQVLEATGREASVVRRRAVAYCRVSSAAQKPDLKNQRAALESFCAARGLADVEWIEEVGGGLNFKRKRFGEIMRAVESDEVGTLVVAHKDRLVRFGFDWFADLCARHGCDLLILNNESLSPEVEMVQDLMTVVHCFSSRLYGLRSYKKAIKEAASHVDP